MSAAVKYCSFCGKPAHEVSLLIAAPLVFICDECVDKAAALLADHRDGKLASADAPAPVATIRQAPRRCQIYFIYCEAAKAIKIGYARDASIRLSNLQIGSPAKLELIGWFWGSEKDEEAAHLAFHHLRMSGEWFRDAPELREYIAGQLR